MKHPLLLSLAALLLSGCAFHRTPYVAYEGVVPLANTAVFASFDEETLKGSNDARIQAVNGKSTPCSEVGCPYWVRVLPGRHTFSVRYTSNHQFVYGGIAFKVADLAIEVPDMKPRHVYVARYKKVDGHLTFIVEDLGERPKFGITLGLEGANRTYYPVEFQ